MTDNISGLPPPAIAAPALTSTCRNQNARLHFFLGNSGANSVIESKNSPEEPQIVPSSLPIPSPRVYSQKPDLKVVQRPSLSVLFPPEKLLNRTRDERLSSTATTQTIEKTVDAADSSKTISNTGEHKDFASAVHPTAPRVPAPTFSSKKVSKLTTVRGPKGVSHPQLKDRLLQWKAKFKRSNSAPPKITADVPDSKPPNIAQQLNESSKDTSHNEVSCSSQNEASSSEEHETSITSSSDYQDAYAELVKELARHEEFVAVQSYKNPIMPVHETAFLPQRCSPQRGTAAPWIPTRDSEGYTTTDDELEGAPLRRAYSSRHYDRNARFYDHRTRSLSPPTFISKPFINRSSTPIISNKQLDEARRLQAAPLMVQNQVVPIGMRSDSPLVLMSTDQRRYRQDMNIPPDLPQPSHVSNDIYQQVPTRQNLAPSPLIRSSPLRASVGSRPSRGQTQIYGTIREEALQDLPVMRRSNSLNAEQIRRNKSVTLPSLRTQSNGLLDSSQKRVSFSNFPSSSGNPREQQQRTGIQYLLVPHRRPSSSSSVFLYPPVVHYEAPDKPLPPVPEHQISPQVRGQYETPPTAGHIGNVMLTPPTRWQSKDIPHQNHPTPDSESGSEAGEIQRILFKPPLNYGNYPDDEWTADGKSRGPPGNDINAPPGNRDEDVRSRGGGGSRTRRDEPRRHTLSGEQQTGAGSAAANLSRSMDLEAPALQRSYYHQPAPMSSSMFDDDPGIMSEVETASTGFRRGGKQRSSLPVVRTPSKTLERPLGLVFLQYRNETKRALLPNEITSIDTVKALFVRSFPKQLTMEYLDSPMVKIYIHDSSKDMFYELEDLRSHLRDIRDRSVLRLFETPDINGGTGGGVPVGGTPMPGGLPPHPTPAAWDQDQSYFSEPEFDSEYQHQHIHKTKGSSKGGNSPYYMAHSYPPGQPGGGGGAATLPRGAPVIRAYSPATKSVSQAGVTSSPVKPQRIYQEISDVELRSPTSNPSLSSPLDNQPRPQSTPPRPPERWAYLARSRKPMYSDRLHTESGYMSSPERGRPPYAAYPAAAAYEDPYYAQYGPRSGSITPVIDEEASDSDELLMDAAYSIYSSKVVGGSSAGSARIQQPTPRPPSFPATGNIASQSAAALVPYDATRIRVEHMERQLANLTGLVQKALTQGSSVVVPGPRDFLQIPPNQRDAYRNDDYDKHSSSSSASLPDETYLLAEPSPTTLSTKPPKLGKDKSVSFEKSVSFSDDPPDMLSSPKQHTPQHSADTKPTKPAIKSSTLPRTSSQERDRHKPAPPPKPMSLSTHPGQYDSSRHLYRADLQLTPEMYNHLRVLQKKAKDLRQEVRNLRRMSQAQAHSVRETIRDTFIKIRAMLLTGGGNSWLASGDSEKLRVSREEELYKQEMLRLEKDLTELESTVEELRGNVINKKTRVNMSDVENMALVLSKSSKTVADLKVRFPSLQDGMKSLLSSEMEKVVREEKFLKEEPERLESALRRCKKLTGTLVTLKRLASVQEQRLPVVVSNSIQDQTNQRLSPDNLLQEPSLSQHSGAISPQSKSSGDGCSPASSSAISARSLMAATGTGGGETAKRQENALDTLLDELQTFARPPSDRHGSIDASTPQISSSGTLRRLHSYPSSDSSSPVRSSPVSRLQVSDDSKPPSLPERSKVPPPPPPRTSSRSPLVSPTSPPRLGPRHISSSTGGTLLRRKREPTGEHENNNSKPLSSNSSSSESINSQEGLRGSEALEQRHQELLRRQRQLQEQYARLQQLQRNVRLPPAPELKKTGSESNLLRGLNLSAAPTSGSLTHLASTSIVPISMPSSQQTLTNTSGSSKIYETDIL